MKKVDDYLFWHILTVSTTIANSTRRQPLTVEIEMISRVTVPRYNDRKEPPAHAYDILPLFTQNIATSPHLKVK